jgi:hypothetical protein
MRKVLPFLFVLFMATSAMAERVAVVIGVEGEVTVVREGNHLPVTRREKLYKADQILTGQNSAIELKMLDGSFINLGELADMFIKELVYDPIKKDGFMDLEVAVGAFRIVSGSIAKLGPDLMQLKIPVATIGIRGTGLVGKASPVGAENWVILVKDPEGHIGELVVQNTVGITILSKESEGVTMIYPDKKLARKKYTQRFILELIQQVPEIKFIPIHKKQFDSLFEFQGMRLE